MRKYLREIKVNNEEETKAFALEIARNLKPNDVIALNGDLGTGKTFLTREIANALGVKRRVNSPTFNIVKEYQGDKLKLYHFDVYRLEDGDEFFEIGGNEYFNKGGVSILEWADIIEEELPKETKFIDISYTDKEGERIFKCTF